MGVPVLLSGQGFINAIVEVFVVGEDDMAADVVELRGESDGVERRKERTYESFLCDICGSQATWHFVVVNDHP